MKHSRSYQRRGASANRSDYDRVFVLRVHKLIKLGYDQLSSSDYATEGETVITGDMAEAIEQILEYPDEEWMRFYRAYDDSPVNELMTTTRRRGKQRRRVDIKLDSSELSPYTRFHFEAKRLGKGNPVSKYLGADGLGCFLSGSYAETEQRGGMLGYVQSDDEQAWAAKIDRAMASKLKLFGLRSGCRYFRLHQLIAELRHTYISEHRRSTDGEPIQIYHSLLMFY